MKTGIKIGLAVIGMGILGSLLFGGAPDRDADIPGLIQSGALLIDVRTPGEYAAGHIDGAVNIPYDRIALELSDIPKDRPIIVYCRSGSRSAHAKRTLESAGCTAVVNGGGLQRMRSLLEE